MPQAGTIGRARETRVPASRCTWIALILRAAAPCTSTNLRVRFVIDESDRAGGREREGGREGGREEGARNEGGGRERDRFPRKEEKQSRRIKLPGSLVHPIRIQFRVLVAAEIDQGRGGSRSIRSTMLYTSRMLLES